MTEALATQTPAQEDIEQHRIELTGYCYRMLGSAFEADDAVQETMVRAWKSIDRFEGRSSLRSWLYRIATNVCLTTLDGRQRRARPMDLGPSSTADTPIGPRRPELPWIEPMPDGRALPPSADPAVAAELKESIRLAFVVALQYLPARQRAVLILRDVLHWKAEEVAKLLDSSVASVNSALQRAKATISAENIDITKAPRASDATAREWAARYADSFERYDIDGLVSLLRQDVVMSMPPHELWLQGADQVLSWLTGQGKGCEGSRVVQTEANGSVAFGQYRKDHTNGGHVPWALQVVDFDQEGKVSEIMSFLDTPHLFPLFGLPERLEA